jgi:membrane associated rhomboid family serine protease
VEGAPKLRRAVQSRRLLLPLRTDAPLHHRPWATVGVIVINIAVHLWTEFAEAADVLPYVLRYGEWAPWQWLTSVFLHAGWFHLLGNMLFLWVFGLVVEGKVGCLRFLAMFVAIAAAAGAFEQTVMLGADEGGSVGASGVIYGLIGVCMVWAPENEVECVLVVMLRPVEFEVSIRTLAYFYFGLEAMKTVLLGFSMSSAALHLIGAAAGVPLGLLMLKRGWVDCEGWDWFSRRDYRAAPIRTSPRPAPGAAAPRPRPAHAESAAVRFGILVSGGDLDGALRLHDACTPAERSSLSGAARERLHRALIDAGRAGEARRLVRPAGTIEFGD